MTHPSTIFKNLFFLNFVSPKMENKFSCLIEKKLFKYNSWLCLICLTFSSIDLIYESIVYKNLIKIPSVQFIVYTRIISYIITIIFFIQTCLNFFLKNIFLQKFVAYSNFLLIFFPFYNFREILFNKI